MALLSIARIRWRERLSAWWDEYYLDNPIVWALQRRAVRFTRLEGAVKDPEQATPPKERKWRLHMGAESSNRRALPLWTRARTLWAILWWTLALAGIVAIRLDPSLAQLMRQWIEHRLTIILLSSSWGLAASLGTGSAAGLLRMLRETNQLTAVGMTRLTGAHVVYGGLLASWLRGTLMRTLMGYLPLLWLFHTVLCGGALRSLFTAVAGALLWNAVVLMVLLISLSLTPLTPSAREAGAGEDTSEFSIGHIAALFLIPAGLVIVLFMALWPLLMLATPVAWLIALAIRPAAIRHTESVLRSREPVITPSEGRWQ